MKEYFKQLDALRFYAVFSVMFSHLSIISLPANSVLKLIYLYVPGVPLFFCISGFLITGILIQNKARGIQNSTLLKNFYIRRFLRIFPIYYLTIFCLYLVNVDGYRDWFINDILYISNIAIGLRGSFDGILTPHFWSLAVEEQFYLFWPALFLIFGYKRQLLLSICLFATGVVFTVMLDFSFLNSRTMGSLVYLGSGALLAVMYDRKREIIWRESRYFDYVLILFGLLLISLHFELITVDPVLAFGIRVLIIPVLTLRFAIGFKSVILQSIMENPVILYLGKISYGIYVYHFVALFPAVLIKKWLAVSVLEDEMYMQIFKIVLTIIISAISWELLEKNINKLKKRFPYQGREEISLRS